MENYWHLGRWFRIPVAMHWTVLLAFPWLWVWSRSLVFALIGLAAFVPLKLVHEFGHAAMARWRGLVVDGITINFLHGETSHGYPRNERDDILIAWSGVAAQALVLLPAWAAQAVMEGVSNPWVLLLAEPVLMVWTVWNAFLMIVALLPIGPMDGHRAWRVIPYLRRAARNRRSGGGKVVKLDAARRRRLERSSEQAAADIISKLGKKK